MPRNPDNGESTTIALRIPVAQLVFLRSEAERNDRTVSAEVRLLVRQAMEVGEERKAA